MAPLRTDYSTFNYKNAFGDNPFAGSSSKISELIDKYVTSSPFGSSGGGSSGSSSSFVATPDDQDLQPYMEHTLGDQRRTLDEYVQRAAGAGIKRGGMNVVGGPALDSALHQEAMRTLAAGSADRFRDAMSYSKSVKEAQYQQSQDQLKNVQNLYGLQHQYLSSQADWQNRLGDQMHSDWRGDVDWDRGSPRRQIELQGLRREADMQRRRDTWSIQDRQSGLDREADKGQRWQQYLFKASQPSARPTGADSAQAERLGVEMGYLKPWERSFKSTL